MKTYATVDAWFDDPSWHDEVAALRTIVRAAGLTETMKWKQPCYTDHDRNILLISRRKHHAIVSLVKGALVDDPRGRLVQPGQERSGRYMPFTSVAQIEADRGYLEGLIARAIEVERAGLRVEPLPDTIDFVDELRQRMAQDEAFRQAFEALTPGRQRGYNVHFERAKRSSTREDRITAATPRILLGKGLLDCICGHSQRFPRCDGSHKNFP